MERQLDQQVEQFKSELDIKVINKGGIRRSRRFEKIVDKKVNELKVIYEKGVMVKERDEYFEERMRSSGNPDISQEEKIEILEECLGESFNKWT